MAEKNSIPAAAAAATSPVLPARYLGDFDPDCPHLETALARAFADLWNLRPSSLCRVLRVLDEEVARG
ncbi:MAG: hypothetical protein AAFV53_19915 [Myxococcota bacterium]